MRERYESSSDVQAEDAAAERLAKATKLNVAKLTDRSQHYSTLDRFVFEPDSKKGVAWLEIKRRKHAFGTYPTLLLSAGKWDAGVQKARSTGLKFTLLIVYDNGDYHYTYDPAHVESGEIWCEWGGRTLNTRDSGDVEPVMHIPVKLFRKLPRFAEEPQPGV